VTATGEPVSGEPLDEDLAGVSDTTQQHTERWLSGWLERHWRPWRARAQMRGQFFLGLYRLRNTLLGIDAQTRRRMLRPSYQANLDAIGEMLAQARQENIDVLVYIVPIRGDLALPYDPAEYAAFRADIQRLCDFSGAEMLNLEDLVPPQFWGRKDATGLGGQAELDFMHFQYPGHRRLAETLAEHLGSARPESGPAR
jgi:hypothetical protein